jgi:hypothetical protein
MAPTLKALHSRTRGIARTGGIQRGVSGFFGDFFLSD